MGPTSRASLLRVYPDIESLWRRAGVGAETLERLAEADAFTALGVTRRDALWQARALRAPGPSPLFGADGKGGNEPAVTLAPMTLGEEMVEDYLALRLSLRAHPMELLRPRLAGLTAHDRLAQPDAAWMAEILRLKREELDRAERHLRAALDGARTLGSLYEKYGLTATISLPVTDEVTAHICACRPGA